MHQGGTYSRTTPTRLRAVGDVRAGQVWNRAGRPQPRSERQSVDVRPDPSGQTNGTETCPFCVLFRLRGSKRRFKYDTCREPFHQGRCAGEAGRGQPASL